jgi:hypothetical protein
MTNKETKNPNTIYCGKIRFLSSKTTETQQQQRNLYGLVKRRSATTSKGLATKEICAPECRIAAKVKNECPPVKISTKMWVAEFQMMPLKHLRLTRKTAAG